MVTEQAATNVEKKYPDGVFAMFILQALTMVGFTMLLALLVLYCTRQLGMSDSKAYTLLAAYNALVFASSVFGGYLGERYLGYRYAVTLSILLATVGLLILMIPKVVALYWGLAFFVIATGIMVPCMFVLLGRIYKQDNDPRRDSGFTIAYIGMNVGSFFASVISGFVANDLGYDIAFLIGALFTLVTLFFFLYYKHYYVRRRANAVTNPGFVKERLKKTRSARVTGLFLVAIAVPLTAALLNFARISNILMLLLGAFCVFLVIYLSINEGPHYRKKLIAFLVLTIISVAFWSLYSIAPSALEIFIARNVNRHLFGTVIPAATYYSLNPFFIITLGPLLTIFWMWLNQRGYKLATPAKFAIGVLSMGLGYLILVVAISFHSANGQVGSLWIVLSYFFQTFGELFVGPIGFAMVGELVPPRLEGLMMGIWQLATGVAGALSQYMANMTTTPNAAASALSTNPVYGHAFLLFGAVTVVVGLIAVCLVPYLNRIVREANAERLTPAAN